MVSERTDLYSIHLDELHCEALRAVDLHSKSVSYLLKVIEVVDDRKLYEVCELTSLYQYCTRLLNLSEAVSYELIAVVRKGREVPELKRAVLENRVTLSKAKKICSVVTAENFDEWIALAACETSRVIEKCVAGANPKECVKESAKYKTADRLEFKLGVGEEFMDLLASAKDLLSQIEGKAISSEDALVAVLKSFVEKLDPVKKAERAAKRAKKKRAISNSQAIATSESENLTGEDLAFQVKVEKLQFPGSVARPARLQSKRKRIEAKVLHQVRLRDGNRCSHISKVGRCDQKRWLDIHHVRPVSRGGNSELANLTTLCSGHHRMIHGH